MIVTILILIDGFLQYKLGMLIHERAQGHNPYFNRWFSAIESIGFELPNGACHNPYFNRWFSAIYTRCVVSKMFIKSQSLF